MITENIDKKYPQKKQYSDLSAVRAACLFVVKALNKLVEEMNNQVYFDFDTNGLILRATDKESLQRASNKLEHWKDQTSIGILTDSISKEDYKKFIDSDLQSLLRQERAFINVISFDKFLAACEFLEKKGYKEPRLKYEEIQQEKKNFALLMCTKHRYKEIKERIETMLEPLRKVKKKKKITSSLKLASTWDEVEDISIGTQIQKLEKENVVQPLDTIGFLQVQQQSDDKSNNQQLSKESSEMKEIQQKELLTHEIILLEIEQWLFYFSEILLLLEESDKIKKQDEESNFSILLVYQKFQIEEMHHNHNHNHNFGINGSVEVGFLQIKALRESISNEQNKLIQKIKQKNGPYLDHILQNKPKEFVNYLFSEMEPEEKEYFQVFTLRELLESTHSLIEKYQYKPQIQSMSTRKKNIIFNLKEYIERFNDNQLVTIESDGNIYNQYFLKGEQNIHKIFAETVDRTEMMFVKACATNYGNQNLNNRLSESDSEHMDLYEGRKYSMGGNDISQINSSNYNDQNQTVQHQLSNNQNNKNNHQHQHHYHHHHQQQQPHQHRNLNNINGGGQINYYQQEIDNQIFKSALVFLTTNNITSNLQIQQQQQQEEIVLIQVESSQLIPNKNNPNFIEYQNTPYYLKKFKEQQLQEVTEAAIKNKLYSTSSCVQIHKVIQINQAQPLNSDNSSQYQQNQTKEFGILMDRKDYCIKNLIEEGYLFSVYQQVDVALKIVKCLNQIHNQREKRGAHCNLKPNNILLDSSYNVYLTDMGIDSKKNTHYFYSHEHVYANSMTILKNKLKNQFLQITDQIIQSSIENIKNIQSNNGNSQYQLHQNIVNQPEVQFKQVFQQQQSLFYNQLADLQALGLIFYEIFTGQCITAENYFLKNHRQFIKRMSQESPTLTLKSIFTIIFNLLELQFTSTDEVIPLLQEIYNKF